MPTRLPDTTELKRLYVNEGLSLREIARRYGVTHQAVHLRLVAAGIKFRPRFGRKPAPLKRKELYGLYVVEGLNIRETAKRLGVTVRFASRELDRHRIKRRTVWDHESHRIDRKLLLRLYVTDGLTQIETAEHLGIPVRIVQSELRRHRIKFRNKGGVPPTTYRFTRDELYKLYHHEALSCGKIGKRYGMDRGIVRYQMIRLGIKRRPAKRKR